MSTAIRTYHDYDNYGSLDSMTDEDWWVVSFDYDGIAAFWLGNIPTGCDYDLALWDDTGTARKYASNSGTTAEYMLYEVEADRNYYIQVHGWEGANDPNSEYWFRTKIYPHAEVMVTLHIQQTTSSCGSACGIMILDSLGFDISESTFLQWNKNTYGDDYTFVYAITNTINHFLDEFNSSVNYRYVQTKSYTDDQQQFLVAENLSNGYPVEVCVKISDKTYFDYTTDGHYVVIGGLFYATTSSQEMTTIYDPHYAYGDVIDVPLSAIFEYSGQSNGFVICVETIN